MCISRLPERKYGKMGNIRESARKYTLKVLTKIFRKPYNDLTEGFVELRDQQANDYVRDQIHQAKNGLMVSKWGTTELGTVCSLLSDDLHIPLKDIYEGKVSYDRTGSVAWLVNNSGFFPNSLPAGEKFAHLALEDAREIDILGSYAKLEYYVRNYTEKARKINLNGYYAPFLWENPWTKELKGKKVLVVHPFAETIKKQYDKREHLFENPDVLPEFKKLTVIKAVQSIAGNNKETGFEDWFEALDFMKNQMDQSDYEIALIGCGAYGMSLAAHAKRHGKIAIHMAGWTQMLFGIYGNRWIEDQPEFKKYINEYWTRPSIDERPKNVEKVEGGCYW